MKTEKRQIYITPRVIRLGFIAATLLVPFGLCITFIGVISLGDGVGIIVFVPGIIIAVGIPILLVGARQHSQAFNNNAIITTAEIVHLESKSAKGGGYYGTSDFIGIALELVFSALNSTTANMDHLVTFQFDAQGSDNTVKPMRLQAQVSQEFYETSVLGERTPVRYARAYPRIAYLKGETGYYQETPF